MKNTATWKGAAALAIAALLLTGCGSAPKIPSFDEASYQKDKEKTAKRYVEVKRPKDLKKIQRVIISDFRVQFVNRAGASYGRGVGADRVSVAQIFKIKDFDQARLQAITDQLYDDLVRRLEKTGIQVISPEQLSQSEHWQALNAQGEDSPQEKKVIGATQGEKALVFAPSHMKLPKEVTLRQGFKDLKRAFKGEKPRKTREQHEGSLMEEFSAALLKPRYTVGFAHFAGRKSGLDAVQITTNYRFTIVPQATEWTFYPTVKRGIPAGRKLPTLTLTEAVIVPGEFVVKAEESTSAGIKAAEAAAKLLKFAAALSGVDTGKGSSKTREYDLTIDNAAYAQLAKTTLPKVNDLFTTRIAMVR